MNLKSVLEKIDLTEPEEVIVTNVLQNLGFRRNLKGFNYIRYAIVEVNNNPELLFNKVTKELYPGVADKFNDTPNKVERAIRFAIEKAVGSPEGYPIFKGRKFTNSEFIAFVVDEINLRRTSL